MGVPPGIKLGQQCLPSPTKRTLTYKWSTLIFTFFIYCSYHISRKPISVIKSVLRPDNCSVVIHNGTVSDDVISLSGTADTNGTQHCGWPPFDGASGKAMLGSLDTAFLFPYAIGMFISGHIAERVSLRYFLTCGMLLSGTFTALFGLGYYFNIHAVSYYLSMQAMAGFVQATGWPSVVTCVANWFGKGQRGLIMGLWNSHTSFGNILGSVIAGSFADSNWGLSFIVPAAIIGGLGLLVFFFLVPSPADINCDLPDHQKINHNPSVDRIEDAETEQEDDDDVTPINRVREGAPLLPGTETSCIEHRAVSFLGALRIPGVVEFSLCLFFAKLVSYVFLYWLPDYITKSMSYNAEVAANLSTLFDFGGIVGGVLAGVISDYTGGRATTCVVMLILAAPMLFIYLTYGAVSLRLNIVLLFLLGSLVNGPYALITTAVSADLGTHDCLRGNAKALATVTAIIDGTGSIGAAIGPQLAGLFTKWRDVFIMLMIADVLAMLLLVRLVFKEVKLCNPCRSSSSSTVDQA